MTSNRKMDLACINSALEVLTLNINDGLKTLTADELKEVQRKMQVQVSRLIMARLGILAAETDHA